MEYLIVTAEETKKLEHRVNMTLLSGYVAQGDVSVSPTAEPGKYHYVQALVKKPA